MTLRVKVLSVAKRKKKRIAGVSWERAPFDRFPKLEIKSDLVARKKRMNKYLKESASFILIPPFSFPPHSSVRTMKTNDKKRPQMTRERHKKMERNKTSRQYSS